MAKPYHRTEREALSDLFLELGPAAPTLCEGWATADLAAHLVLREGHPFAALGIWVKALSARADRVQNAIRDQTPWPDLVELVRRGPPLWSPLRPPALDRAANTIEFYIHHEDARRGQPGWQPRSFDADLEDALWAARRISRMHARSLPVGIVLRWPGHDDFVAKAQTPSATVIGPPSELLLFTSGRRAASRVSLEGDPQALAQLGVAPAN